MFDIGFPELVVIAIVGLLVIGPERLPEALRTLGLWIGRLRRSFTNVKAEIEKEIGMDEIRRQLHNEAVMEEMKRIERDVRRSVDSGAAQGDAGPTISPPSGTEPREGAPAPPEAPGSEPGEGASAPPGPPGSERAEDPPPEDYSPEPHPDTRSARPPRSGGAGEPSPPPEAGAPDRDERHG